MANEEIVLRIKPIMETGDVKSAVAQMEGFFSKMKLTPNMKGEVNQIFKDMAREADIFAEKSKGAFKTASDVKSFEQSGKKIEGLFQQISNIMTKLGGGDISKLFNIDTSKIQTAQGELAKLEQKIKQVGGSSFTNLTNAINELNNVSKSKSIDAFFSAFKTGDLDSAGVQLKNLISNIQAFGGATEGTKKIVQDMLSNLAAGKITEVSNSFQKLQSEMGNGASTMKTYVTALQTVVQNMNSLSGNTGFVQATRDAELLKKEIEAMNTEQLRQIAQIMLQASGAIKDCGDSFNSYNSKVQQGAASTRSLGQEIDSLKNRATYFLSLTNSVNLFKQGIRKAIDTVKELDKAMAETAVVTDFSIGDMWDKLPEYTKMANELGVATQGVYEASTLYYQQGLQTEQVMALTAETLKMARIAGLEYADATNLMTAALRGFNMEINETSAQRVNDVYSELAAITAADTNEIATAMTKTASIASSANMELETTAALLAQMIETTREPAETAGTAMKTIIARFTEMKKSMSDIVVVEGEEVSVNKVDAALASVGVSLKNANNEFRDLDDVLLELASKWNSLDIMSQRYIATTAAGSRQQSRFIAMMQDYERTMELVDAAYNSAGSSSKQFEKTQESLESKMSRMENAWNTFLMGIADDQIIKTLIDALTSLLNAYNKLTEGMNGVFGSAVRLGTVFAGLRLAKLGVDKLVFHFANLKLQAEGAVAAVSKLSIIDKFRLRLDNFKNTGKFSLKGTAVDPDNMAINTTEQQLTTGASKGAQIQIQGATEAAKLLIDGAAAAAKIGQEGAAAESVTEIEGEQVANASEIATATTEGGIETTAATAKAGIEVAGEEAGAAIEVAGEATGAGISGKPDVNEMLNGGGSLKGGFTKAFESAKTGVSSLISTLAPLAPLIGVLVAEVGLLAAAWYFSPEQTLKREIEDATNAAKSAQEVFSDVSSTLNEMTSSRDGLAQMREEFEGMTKGTSEWRSQLAEINAEVLRLIRIYPELAKYQTYGENGELQLTEEGWDTVIQKQTQYAAIASTSTTVAAARVDQLQSELEVYQQLEDKQDELAVGDNAWGIVAGTGSGAVLGTGGAIVGAMLTGATLGNVIPGIGTAIGALVGIIAGAAIGYATNKAIENSTESSEEYQAYKRELEQQQEAERQARLQQYSAALYNEFSTDEEMSKDENLGVATELMAETFENNMESVSEDMGLDDWTSDGANDSEIEEWAENLGYKYEDGKVYNQAGEVVYKVEKSGDAHEGEEGWITNEQIAQQLAVQKATNATEEQTKALLGIMNQAEEKMGLEEGGFTDLFYGDDLSGKQIRQLMKMDVSSIEDELEQISKITGQDMNFLIQQKKQFAEQYAKALEEEMAVVSLMKESEKDSYDGKTFDKDAYINDFKSWISNLDDEKYGILTDSYSAIKENIGANAAQIFINNLYDDFKDNSYELGKALQVFENIDFSNPIKAYSDLKKAASSANEEVANTAREILKEGELNGSLSQGAQLRYILSSEGFQETRSELEKLSKATGSISAENIYEVAEAGTDLRIALDSGAIGAATLAQVLNDMDEGLLSSSDLTDNFIKALSQLNSVADITAKTMQRIKDLKFSDSSTEVGKFYSNMKKEALELYELGAYGDSKLIEYMKHILGADQWRQAVKEAGGDYKKAMEPYIEMLQDNTETMYSDWKRAASLDTLEYISMNSAGDIVFDFQALPSEITTVNQLIEDMAQKLGVSEAYVEAMITDMKTFSSDFESTFSAWGTEQGLNTLLTEATTYDLGGKTYLNVTEEQLGYFVENPQEFVEQFNKDMASENIQISVTPIVEDSDSLKQFTQEKLEVILSVVLDDSGPLGALEDGTVKAKDWDDFMIIANSLYNEYLNIGFDEQAAKEQVTKVFDEEYDLKIGSDTFTELSDDLKTKMQEGLVNSDQIIASEIQARKIAEIYGQYIYQALLAAFQPFVNAIPGMQKYSYQKNGNTYYTNQSGPKVTRTGWVTDVNNQDIYNRAKAASGENTSDGSAFVVQSVGTPDASGKAEVRYKVITTDGQRSTSRYGTTTIQLPGDYTYDYGPSSYQDEAGNWHTSSGTYDTPADNSTSGPGAEGYTGEDGDNVVIENENAPTFAPTVDFNVPYTEEFRAVITAEMGDPDATDDDIETWLGTAQGQAFMSQYTSTTSGYITDGSRIPSGGTTGGDTEGEQVNYAEENSNRQLEALERIRKALDREAELIDKLPEEIAGPLKLLNMGEQMLAEYKEIQINKNKRAALELEEGNARDEAEYLGEYYYYDEFLESYMYDVEKMEGASPETAAKVQEEYNELQELRNKINEVNDELDGGKIQKIVKGLAKASTAASKALKGTEKASDMLNDAFGDLAEKFGLADELDRLGKSIDKAIDESEFLKREFKGLGIVSEETLSKIDSLPLGDATKDLIKNTLGTNENGTIGSWLGDAFGAGGEMLGGMGDLLNFDMMATGLDMFNQMKDMASKMIQYVVQFVQTIINWWINREDWLYNLLSAIEQEVHNFNRQEQVEERFRLYSDEGLNDLVSAWEAMRESLEKQIDLNEQLIKSRQAELQFLNLTNLPFSPAFYYDYTEERVIENPWVYDIYMLLLDIGAMIPEIGGIFSSIKQLMEDNKKRMEDAVKEIEDAREEILELEKQQLELRTKYMEDEIELEELVMDSIIEKQQEEIDELSAMNDAISEGNEKLINTLNSKLDLIRQQRDNEDREEELGEKERRLAYLRQDTSNANRKEIMDLSEELKDERRDYTDELIDQKISALEEQNEKAAEQRQKQIDLLQAQLDHTEKYGLQWAEAQTLIKNGFDSEGRLRVGTDLFDMLMSKEDFTSMGLGSTRQVQQIMDWNVTSIAAAAFREINDIWDEGFGNFEMSNDVHDQSRLHLWADREVDYRQLPSWLSFLQPAYNAVQDYFWRTGNNIGAFAETAWGSGKNSTSILGKTIVPLLQEILGTVKGKYEEYNSLSVADGYVETTTGVIANTMENVGYDWGERIIKTFGNGFAAIGDTFTEGVRAMAQSNSFNNQTSTQSIGDITVQVHIDSEDTEDGYKFGENIANAFREGLSNLSIFK